MEPWVQGSGSLLTVYVFVQMVQTATDSIPWMLEFGRGSFLTLFISFLLVPTALDPVSLRAGGKKSTSRPVAQHNTYSWMSTSSASFSLERDDELTHDSFANNNYFAGQ
jgi:hypothetical protein